jgi:hypothetical protein
VSRRGWGSVVVGAGLAAYAVYAYTQLAPFYEGRQFGTEGCRQIPGFSGPEDFAVDTATGAIFVASLAPVTAPVMVTEEEGAGPSGGVYRFRPGQPPVRLEIEGGPVVRGHGLGLWVDPSGERRLFLVDHAEAGERVVIARVEGSRLVHVRTVESPLFISLNDVAPVGLERFYVTNDHHHPRGPWQRVEDFTFQRRSNLIYFDGQEGKEVLDGLGFGNGVSFDGERLYVAESTTHRVQVLRPTAQGTVEVEAKLALGPGYDNLTILGPGHFLAPPTPAPSCSCATPPIGRSRPQPGSWRSSWTELGSPGPPNCWKTTAASTRPEAWRPAWVIACTWVRSLPVRSSTVRPRPSRFLRHARMEFRCSTEYNGLRPGPHPRWHVEQPTRGQKRRRRRRSGSLAREGKAAGRQRRRDGAEGPGRSGQKDPRRHDGGLVVRGQDRRLPRHHQPLLPRWFGEDLRGPRLLKQRGLSRGPW